MKRNKPKSRIVAVILSITLVVSYGGFGGFGDIDSYAAVNEVFTIVASAGVEGGAVRIGSTNYDAYYKVISENIAEKTANVELRQNLGYKSAAGAVTLPDNFEKDGITYTVTFLGEDAFRGCMSLTVTGLGSNSTITTLGDSCFYYCTSLLDTGLGSNSTITSLGNGTFEDCTSLEDTGLGSNSTITSFGNGTFRDCTSLEDTGLGSNSTIITLEDACFYGCTSLKDTGLGSNSTITTIITSGMVGCFEGCTSLEDTGLGSNSTITTLEGPCFYGCTSLADTGLGSNSTITTITSIYGYGCFEGCTSLAGIVFPSTVASIGEHIIRGCTSIETITFLGQNPPSLSTSTFAGVDALENIIVPNGKELVYAIALKNAGITDTTIKLNGLELQYNSDDGTITYPNGGKITIGEGDDKIVIIVPGGSSYNTDAGTFEFGAGEVTIGEGEDTVVINVPGGTIYNPDDGTITLPGGKPVIPSNTHGSPQNFSAVAGDGKITLTWAAPVPNGSSQLNSYEISKDNGLNWINIGNVHSYVFANLSNGTAYTFKVRAVNSAGAGLSATVVAIPKALEGAGKPVTPVTAIRLPQKSFALVTGKSLTLPVVAYTKDKTKAKLTFASSNPKVAKVSAKGKVIAKKRGKATIKITAANGKTASVKVYVLKKAVKIKKVTLVKAPKKLKKNQTKYLKVKISPKKATGVVVKFRSSKPKVISVDKAGKLTALKKGKATITVSAGGKKVKVSIKVTK
jgi:hypothetical protein